MFTNEIQSENFNGISGYEKFILEHRAVISQIDHDLADRYEMITAQNQKLSVKTKKLLI